ncbi:MAG: carbamate kinase [Spirochaetaceae bacterium]|jgi:carbamate kinase|nr:carbamate kinase [Spirochaetaceae bacterium]GMO29265.1 MAG: carbamate kinase [Termitinemataceae bacterium]
MKKRIVIALGGNALGDNLPEQMVAVRTTATAIVDLIQGGHEVVIVHGNGPQVGMINTAFETASKADQHFPVLPMSVCVALSQGYIGYDLQNALRKELDSRCIKKPVATIITQVEVDPNDKAFENPTKPVGGFMSESEALKLKEKGVAVAEDSGRGWRRVVASPLPVRILETETVKAMLAAGHIPIAAGGGGIPVALKADGQYHGMSAVIDKDFASARLAAELEADTLIILTAVEKVAINFGKPDQKWLDTLSISEAEAYIKENQFAKGSMLPKVQAAISFVKSAPSRTALITELKKAKEGIEGKTGTRIV